MSSNTLRTNIHIDQKSFFWAPRLNWAKLGRQNALRGELPPDNTDFSESKGSSAQFQPFKTVEGYGEALG